MAGTTRKTLGPNDGHTEVAVTSKQRTCSFSLAKLLFLASTLWWMYFQVYFMQSLTATYTTARVAEARASRLIVTAVDDEDIPKQDAHGGVLRGSDEAYNEQDLEKQALNQETKPMTDNTQEKHKPEMQQPQGNPQEIKAGITASSTQADTLFDSPQDIKAEITTSSTQNQPLSETKREIQQPSQAMSILERCLSREQYTAMTHPIPSVILLGGDKCGSTTLHQGLARTKDFASPRIFPGEDHVKYKEIYFFNEDWANNKSDQCTKASRYLTRFARGTSVTHIRELNDKLTIDATPNYGREAEVPRRVYEFYPAHLRAQLKFLWVIRDPSARAQSWHKFCKKLFGYGYRASWVLDCVSHKTVNDLVLDEAEKVTRCLQQHPCPAEDTSGESGNTFAATDVEDAKEQQKLPDLMRNVRFQCQHQWNQCASKSPVLGGGMFAHQLQTWHQYFLPSQFMVLFTDDLRADPETSFSRALEHVNDGTVASDAQVRAAMSVGSVNSQGKYKKETSTLDMLDVFFAPHNRKLIGLVPGAEHIEWVAKERGSTVEDIQSDAQVQ
jgi:hypothetical protein